MLDKDLIPQSHLWTLRMLVSRRALDVVLFPPVDTDDIIHRVITLDPSSQSPLRAIEDVIYDNPLLLNQFKSVSAAIDTDHFVILPSLHGDDDTELAARAIQLTTGLDEQPAGALTAAEATADTTLFFSAENDLSGFLRRTFYNIGLTHPLAPIIRYMSEHPTGEETIIAALRDNRLDIVAMHGPKLLLANTFTFDAIADAAYYILAVRANLPLSASAKIYLWGESAVRDNLADIIGRAATQWPTPAPLPIPSAMWRSGSAVASSPLPLILQSAL